MCAPRRLAEAHDVLAAEGGDAAVIAGGQTLVPLLSMRMARPKVVVDIMHVEELGGIAVEDDAIRVGAVGAAGRIAGVAGLAARQPLLAQALPWVGHCADARARHGVRLGRAGRSERGTAAVSCWRSAARSSCRPKADSARVAADDFFTGLMSTARRDDELIEAVSFPCRARRRRLRVPRVRAPARRFRHRGLRGGRDGEERAARGRRRRGPAGGARLRTTPS